MSEQLGVLFLVLFVAVSGVCVYLSVTMSRRVQAAITRWRNEEKQSLEIELKQLAMPVHAYSSSDGSKNTNSKLEVAFKGLNSSVEGV
jgi:hypothetical protein